MDVGFPIAVGASVVGDDSRGRRLFLAVASWLLSSIGGRPNRMPAGHLDLDDGSAAHDSWFECDVLLL